MDQLAGWGGDAADRDLVGAGGERVGREVDLDLAAGVSNGAALARVGEARRGAKGPAKAALGQVAQDLPVHTDLVFGERLKAAFGGEADYGAAFVGAEAGDGD